MPRSLKNQLNTNRFVIYPPLSFFCLFFPHSCLICQIEPTVRILEDYVDQTEIQIIHALAERRDNYLCAMDTFSKLEIEIDSTIGSIRMFRNTLGQADNSLVKGGIDIVNIHQRKERLQAIYELVWPHFLIPFLFYI